MNANWYSSGLVSLWDSQYSIILTVCAMRSTFLNSFKICVIFCEGLDEIDDWERLDDCDDKKHSKGSSSKFWPFSENDKLSAPISVTEN